MLLSCHWGVCFLMPTGVGSPAGGFVSHWTRAELGNSDSCTFYVTVIGHCAIPVSLRVRVNEITSITIRVGVNEITSITRRVRVNEITSVNRRVRVNEITSITIGQ